MGGGAIKKNIFFLCRTTVIGELGLVGYDVCLTRRRSRVRFSELVWGEKIFFFHSRALTHTALITTTVAQRFGAAVARWAHNPKAPGSKPGIAIQREKNIFLLQQIS